MCTVTSSITLIYLHRQILFNKLHCQKAQQRSSTSRSIVKNFFFRLFTFASRSPLECDLSLFSLRARLESKAIGPTTKVLELDWELANRGYLKIYCLINFAICFESITSDWWHIGFFDFNSKHFSNMTWWVAHRHCALKMSIKLNKSF